MLKIEINFVDGGAQGYAVPDSKFKELKALQRQGLEGKELIHEWWTDDYGPPPRGISIKGTLDDGTKVNEYIPFA